MISDSVHELRRRLVIVTGRTSYIGRRSDGIRLASWAGSSKGEAMPEVHGCMRRRNMSDQGKPLRSGWYVVQVTPGSEERMCEAISRACEEHDEKAPNDAARVGLRECFSPRFASRKKRMGTWYDVNRALLPGYVIADVRNPASLAQALGRIREFCHVLSGDKTYSPLNEPERRWIEAQSRENDRTIPLSFGYRSGEKLVVTSGFLKGHEALITKVDRKNCLAHVEFHADSITFKTTVGLVVLPNGQVERAE